MAKRSDAPDATVVADIRRVIGTPKAWVATGEMAWIDNVYKPRGFKFRERLALPDGSQPATLFVECYFKPSSIQGNPDKLSLGLFVQNQRALAIDINGPSRHVNSVGVGRPFYGQRVGHPQIHTVSDDALYGYAEPIESMSNEGYWEYFVTQAGITGAPPFKLPILQLGLL